MSLEDTNGAAPTAADSAPAPAPVPTEAPKAAPDKAPEPQTEGEKAQAAEDALDKDLRKVFRNATKDRDETGKFASANPNKPAPPEKVEAGKTSDQPQSEDGKPAPSAPAIAPPNSWSAEAKAKWTAIPPEAQTYIAQRELQAQQAISRLGQDLKKHEPVARLLETHKDAFARNNVGVEEGLAALLKAQEFMDRDPVGAIQWLAQSYGVDLGSMGQGLGQGPDPMVAQMTQRIASLERQLSEQSRHLSERQQAEVRARENSMLSVIDQFAADKPDFDDVAADTFANLQALKQQNPAADPKDLLQQAYDRAVWANPKTRQAQVERAAKQREEAQRKAADEAKAAASVNVRGSAKAQASDDLDSDLRAIYRKRNS